MENELDFKLLYQSYKKADGHDWNAENMLLRAIAFYCKFYSSTFQVIKENAEKTFVTFENRDSEKIWNLYSDVNEANISSNLKVCYFDFICEIIIKSKVSKVVINPNTDNFILTTSQIMDIRRQKMFCETYDNFKLSKPSLDIRPAYNNFSELPGNNCEFFEMYTKTNDRKYLDLFLEKFSTETTFYIPVLPMKNAQKDDKGNPLISADRVLQQHISTDETLYQLFFNLNADVIAALKRNGFYVSIFNFDDLITLIDTFNNVNGVELITGNKAVNVFLEGLNVFKIKKERSKYNKLDRIIFKGEGNEVLSLKDQLNNVFLKYSDIKKVWITTNIEISENIIAKKCYMVHLEFLDNIFRTDILKDINDELKSIFKNRCFSISDNMSVGTNSSLIYQKK